MNAVRSCLFLLYSLPTVVCLQSSIAPLSQAVEKKQGYTPPGVTRAAVSEQAKIIAKPVGWRIVAIAHSAQIKYGSKPVYDVVLDNLTSRDDTLQPPGDGFSLFDFEVSGVDGKPISVIPPAANPNEDCSACGPLFVSHPGDSWKTATTMPPWDLQAMAPGVYLVRLSRYDSADRIMSWSNTVRIQVVP